MFITLVSFSQDPEVASALPSIAAAVEKQLYQHYAPFWQSAGMNVRVCAPNDPVLRDQDCAVIGIYDTPDEPDALGYHSLQVNAKVFGKVFWNPIREAGGALTTGANSLSVTISHEALEAAGNPYVNFWADVDDTTQEGQELCDRVEGDSYDIDGIAVSDFLGPRAFRDGPGPYDWMGVLTKPFEIRPGGYVIRRKGDKVFNLWGSHYPEFKRVIKTSEGSRLAKRQALITSKGDTES